MDSIEHALVLLSCTSKEIKLFLAAYHLGSAPLSDIAKRAKLQRSTAYLIARQLIDKKLLIQDHRNYNQHFTAASPDTLLRMIDAQKRRLGRSSLTLQENLNDLQKLYGGHDAVPHVTTYQGRNGLVSMWNDILSTKNEVLLWTNQTMERQLFETKQHGQFIRERMRKGIPIRVLAVDTSDGRELLKDDAKRNRTTKLLAEDTYFTAETYLYDNKVAIIDYTTDIVGMIIENKQIHMAQRAMFELAWRQTV